MWILLLVFEYINATSAQKLGKSIVGLVVRGYRPLKYMKITLDYVLR